MLEGDRYLLPEAVPTHADGAEMTLLGAEALEEVAQLRGIRLGAGEHRRNVVTRGVQLSELVGCQFSVGSIQCVGVELCEPCWSLEQISARGLVKALVHWGGIRARVLVGGELRRGDWIEALDDRVGTSRARGHNSANEGLGRKGCA